MIYFSHRGANTQRVQNTVAAFMLAHEQGARCFELDVHLLKDGKLAVHHDYSLLASTGVDVKLADLTSADLMQFPLRNSFNNQPAYIPLLQDVLPVVIPGLILLNIELKNDDNCYPGIEEVVCKSIPELIKGRVLFSSFDYACLQRLRALAPKARLGLLTRKFEISQALQLRAESVHINQTRFEPSIAKICHTHGLKVYCYTVNKTEEAARLAAQGVDGIFTDVPALFIS